MKKRTRKKKSPRQTGHKGAKRAKPVSASGSRVHRRAQRIPARNPEGAFDEVVELIRRARQETYRVANTHLVDLYWQIGGYLSRKIESAEWGEGVVKALATHIQRQQPNLRGFTRASLFRMRQFYETYRSDKKVAALLRLLPWTHHLMILGRSHSALERTFYMQASVREGWGSRDLDRQIQAGLFERSVVQKPIVSAPLRQLHPGAEAVFRDTYVLEFLGLPAEHSEADLHTGLVRRLGQFLTEPGRDFAFIGSEYPVQVGGRDFALDLLFFHRGLNALVGIELKVEEFQPEHLGKLQFYLEALDRDVRKEHERPSIGVLLCASKDNEVVEYALARSTSPALIAEYQRMMPKKSLLRAKLHEFHALLDPESSGDKNGS